MSDTAAALFRSALPADPMDLLLDRVADHIAPHFVSCPDDFAIAKQAAVRAICAYQPQSQADLVNAARVIAFSMGALAALAKAAAPGTDPALQLRYYGKANTLNRSAEMNERAIERRQRTRQAAELAALKLAAPEAATPKLAAPDLATPKLAIPEPQQPTEAGTTPDDAAIEARIAAVIQDYVATRPAAACAPVERPSAQHSAPSAAAGPPPDWEAMLLRESAARLAASGPGQPAGIVRSQPQAILRSPPPGT